MVEAPPKTSQYASVAKIHHSIIPVFQPSIIPLIQYDNCAIYFFPGSSSQYSSALPPSPIHRKIPLPTQNSRPNLFSRTLG